MSVSAPAKKIVAPAKPANPTVVKAQNEGKRTKRSDFPIPEGGLIAAVPEGFDRVKHNGLRPKQFSKSYLFLEYRAWVLEQQAAELRKRAEARKSGGEPKEKTLKKAQKLQNQLSSLVETLKAQGVDVAALLANANAAAAKA